MKLLCVDIGDECEKYPCIFTLYRMYRVVGMTAIGVSFVSDIGTTRTALLCQDGVYRTGSARFIKVSE